MASQRLNTSKTRFISKNWCFYLKTCLLEYWASCHRYDSFEQCGVPIYDERKSIQNKLWCPLIRLLLLLLITLILLKPLPRQSVEIHPGQRLLHLCQRSICCFEGSTKSTNLSLTQPRAMNKSLDFIRIIGYTCNI